MDTKNQAWLEKGLGKQLLLKMGWKEGEGLGVSGQGRKGNVTVRKVFEQRGLGFNSTSDGNAGIVKQIHGLNDVLASLQQDHVSTTQSGKKRRSKKEESAEEADESSIVDDIEVASTKKKKDQKRKKQKQEDKEDDNSSDCESSASEEEETSKPKKAYVSSKRRRGYKKFVDAKDVSLYPKEDLKAILGGLGI